MTVVDALSGVSRLRLDSAPVIYYVEAHPIFGPAADAVFRAIDGSSLRAVTTPVTLAECLVIPLRHGNPALAAEFELRLTRGANTEFVPLDPAIAARAADVRARYNLTLLYAFQIAAAIESGCQALLTNDAMLARVSELRVLTLSGLTA